MRSKTFSKKTILRTTFVLFLLVLALLNRDVLGLGRPIAFTKIGSSDTLNSHERPLPIIYVFTDRSEVSDFIKLHIQNLNPFDVRQELLARLESLDYDTNVAVFIGVPSSNTAVQSESVVVVDNSVNIRVYIKPYPGFGTQVVHDPYQVIAIEKSSLPEGTVTFNVVNNFFKIASLTKSVTHLSLSQNYIPTN